MNIRTCGNCASFPQGGKELEFCRCPKLPGALVAKFHMRQFSDCHSPVLCELEETGGRQT